MSSLIDRRVQFLLVLAFTFIVSQSSSASHGVLRGKQLAALNSHVNRRQIAQALSLNSAAELALDKGDYAVAESDARKAMARGWQKSDSVLFTALVKEGKVKAASRYYSAVAAESDENVLFVAPYALLLLNTNHWAPALTAYEDMMNAAPCGDRKWTLRYQLFNDNVYSIKIPNPRKLSADLHIVIGMNGLDWYTWSLKRHYRPEMDLAEFRKALAIEPGSPLTQLAFAYGLIENRRNAEAKKCLRRSQEVIREI
jgi:tetratricopeptide (TPR) repeat protein